MVYNPPMCLIIFLLEDDSLSFLEEELEILCRIVFDWAEFYKGMIARSFKSETDRMR